MDSGILLSICGILTMEKGKSSRLSKNLYTKTPSQMEMSRFRNEACLPECSNLSSNSSGYMSLYTVANRFPSLIAHKSSMKRFVEWKWRAFILSVDIKSDMYRCSNWYKKRFAQNGAGSMPIGIPIALTQYYITNGKVAVLYEVFHCSFEWISGEWDQCFRSMFSPIGFSTLWNSYILTAIGVENKVNNFRNFFN